MRFIFYSPNYWNRETNQWLVFLRYFIEFSFNIIQTNFEQIPINDVIIRNKKIDSEFFAKIDV
jgi:hypothetical protein